MRLRTFRAPTMADALAQVKKDLGKDAVILHTRTAKVGGWFRGWLGLGAKSVVEIVASTDVNVAGPRIRPNASSTRKSAAAPAAAPAIEPKPSAPVPIGAPAPAAVARAYGQPAPRPQPPLQPIAVAAAPEPALAVATEAQVLPVRQRGRAAGGSGRLAVSAPFAPQDGAARAVLEDELADIKRMVGQVLQTAAPSPRSALMPEALFKQYLRLLEGQVARDIADRVVGDVRDELTPAELSDESIVRQTLLRHLANLIPVAPAVAAPGRAGDGRPLTIALVGPTGVGKTTTVAKLAATYKLRYGRKVGLITCDTYRIAAVDQLRTYASIIAVPLKVVLTPAEMRIACESMADCDVILIDTAGRSQHDASRIDELASFIEAARPHETHLVLSSAASEPVMLKAAERFASVGISSAGGESGGGGGAGGGGGGQRLILTKLDEAVNFGVLVNVAQRVNATLSFVTTGQEVPDHIEPGHADRLARLVLDGELAR